MINFLYENPNTNLISNQDNLQQYHGSQYGETRLHPPPDHQPTHTPHSQHGTSDPYSSPTTTAPSSKQPPHHSPNNRTNSRTHNINILQLNIVGIRNKIEQLTHFMHTNNKHITLLQETKLRQTHKTPLRRDRRQGEGGGLITFIRHTIYTLSGGTGSALVWHSKSHVRG